MRIKITELLKVQIRVLQIVIIAAFFLALNPFHSQAESGCRIGYTIDTRQPHTHLFHISLTVN
ncbi:MAG: hypothetical protein JXB23_05850, partial [Candidatus Aminicenantes bacterium]|nr:hypothetical protein [Candidatus Aminicenantes bacterium]